MHYSKIVKIKCKWLVKQELPDPLKRFPTKSLQKNVFWTEIL